MKMKGTFITYRVGESCGMEGENEFVVEAEFGIQDDVYGTGDSPSEWFFDPIKVTVDGCPSSWYEMTELEQEDVEYKASRAYMEEQQ